METFVIVGAFVAVAWMANTSRTTAKRHGIGYGWLLWLLMFALFAVAFPLLLEATMPVDCQTIAINRAMGRCP